MNMKLAATAIAAVLGVTSTASAADLYAFTPAQTAFSATGQGTVSGTAGSYTCSINMTGATQKTVAKITGVTFSGAPGCENVMAVDLPWKVRAVSYSNIQITHAAIMYPGLGRCGPNQVKGALSQGSLTIMDNLPSPLGVCSINVSLTTTPAISIVGAPPPP
jgi:hypothetical protein